MCKIILAISMALIGLYSYSYQSICENHRELLKNGLDVSFWRPIWGDVEDRWHIRCIFTEIEGRRLMLGCTTGDEDRMGNAWGIWRMENGRFKMDKQIGDVGFNCNSESFYQMTFKDGWKVVLGLRMLSAGLYDAERRNIVKPTPDCTFHFTNDGKYYLRPISPDFDTVFKGSGVASVERLCAEWYFGFDFRLPDVSRRNPQTIWSPYFQPLGDLRPGGGVVAPKAFKEFLSEYRSGVRKRLALEQKTIKVMAVFLDADNDGDVDCFVSNDAERQSSGVFQWRLYLSKNGVLSAASTAVVPVPGRRELSVLPISVTAGTSAFCRVLRYDVNPFFVILNDQSPKNLVYDLLFPFETQRVEKLECQMFPE